MASTILPLSERADDPVALHRPEELWIPVPVPPPTIPGAVGLSQVVTGCTGAANVRAGRYRNDPYRATVLPHLFHTPDHHHHHQSSLSSAASLAPAVSIPAGAAAHDHVLSTPRSHTQVLLSGDEGDRAHALPRHRPLPPVQPVGHPPPTESGHRRRAAGGGGAGGGFASRRKLDIAQAATFDRVYGNERSDGASQELNTHNVKDFTPFLPHTAAATTTTATTTNRNPHREHTLFALVRLKHDSQMYLTSFPLRSGDYVVVEADRGTNIGMVERVSAEPPPHRVVSRALRVATPREVLELAALRLEEQAVVSHVEYCAQHILHLPMEIIDVEFQFDKNKLTIYFRSDDAVVDFRKLQRSLFKRYGCRIWLVAEQRQQGSAGEVVPAL